MAHYFFTIGLRDCVGDRALGPHKANLFGMGRKYADVMAAELFLSALDLRHTLRQLQQMPNPHASAIQTKPDRHRIVRHSLRKVHHRHLRRRP